MNLQARQTLLTSMVRYYRCARCNRSWQCIRGRDVLREDSVRAGRRWRPPRMKRASQAFRVADPLWSAAVSRVSRLDSVAAACGTPPANAEMLHTRPGTIQQLKWRAPYVSSTAPLADPVRDRCLGDAHRGRRDGVRT